MIQRKGTYQQWFDINPVLLSGEIGFESDTGKFKIGNGNDAWNALPYFVDTDQITILTQDYATEQYVDNAVSGIVDGAPGLLNTLNELAAAIGDDPNFLSSYATTSYVDTAINSVDISTKQDVVSGVSSTEIGYLDGVTSAIQTQLNNKLESSDLTGYATETYVDNAVSNVEVDLSTAAGNALDWNAGTSQFDVNITSVVNGIPTGTFAVPGDIPSLTGYATESYVTTAIGNVIDSAPGALNTLNELAAAINDDASYAATITTALGTKAPLASPTFTGTVDFTGATVTGIPTTSAATSTTLGTVYGLTDTDGNVALGRFSSLTGGNWNIAIGDNAMKNNTNGSNNVSIGEASMENFLTGDSNTAVGDYSLNNIEDSQDNTAIGGGALIRLWSGYKNTALGSQAGTIVGGFSGSNNLLLGADSSPSSDTVSNEVTIGNQDITRFRIPGLAIDWDSTNVPGAAATPMTLGSVYGKTPQTSSGNISIGYNSSPSTTSGEYNTSIGSEAGYSLTSGTNNIALGAYSLWSVTSNSQNVSVGNNALFSTAGYGNTALGHNAGTNTTGGQNTLIGWEAGSSLTSGSYNIVIGENAQASSNSASYEITLGNSNITKFRIPGLSVNWSTSAYGRATYASTSQPSGGNDGDLWIVYS